MSTTPTTSYEPYEWTDTEETPIFAEDLNHMEEGITKAHLGQNILDIDTSIVSNPTGHTPLTTTYPDSAMKDIITQLIKSANNEEYNYGLIGEEQLKETVYPTLGEAIKRMALRLFNLEAMAYHEVRFTWAPNDTGQWLKFYRVGPVVIVNCALITYFETGKTHPYSMIPNGYRPITIATANLSLPNSSNIIGTATVSYRENGTVSFRTSTGTVAEYYHTLAWITEDEFPYSDASVG